MPKNCSRQNIDRAEISTAAKTTTLRYRPVEPLRTTAWDPEEGNGGAMINYLDDSRDEK